LAKETAIATCVDVFLQLYGKVPFSYTLYLAIFVPLLYSKRFLADDKSAISRHLEDFVDLYIQRTESSISLL
jgi:hypothetical protein